MAWAAGRRDREAVAALRDYPWWLETARELASGCPDGCWEWKGPYARSTPALTGPLGRGLFSARRVLWLALVGAVPARRVLHVVCGDPSCVRPEHCAPVTFGELVRDPDVHTAGARYRRRTTCARGHVLLERPGRCRACVECPQERRQAVRQARQLLGLPGPEYNARYGDGRSAAEAVLAQQGIPTPTKENVS